MDNACSKTCGICLSSVKSKNYKLDCGHEFHTKCLTPWLLENNTCPICRDISYNIDSDEEEEEEELSRYTVMLPNNVTDFNQLADRIDDLIEHLELGEQSYYNWKIDSKGNFITKYNSKSVQTIISIELYAGDEPNSVYIHPNIRKKFMHNITYLKNDKWTMKNKFQNRFKKIVR